jgi:hypothetical protein
MRQRVTVLLKRCVIDQSSRGQRYDVNSRQRHDTMLMFQSLDSMISEAIDTFRSGMFER